MGRRRQAEKITLTVKGEPSAATLPVEIALCLPCMSEIRKRSGGSVLVADGKLIWCAKNNFAEEG